MARAERAILQHGPGIVDPVRNRWLERDPVGVGRVPDTGRVADAVVAAVQSSTIPAMLVDSPPGVIPSGQAPGGMSAALAISSVVQEPQSGGTRAMHEIGG